MDTQSLWVLSYWSDRREPYVSLRQGYLLEGSVYSADHRVLASLDSLALLLSKRELSPLDIGGEIVRYIAPAREGVWHETQAISLSIRATERYRPELLSEWDRPRPDVAAEAVGDDLPF